MMTEYLANIRFIKMYSWEKALVRMVEGVYFDPVILFSVD